MGAKEEPSHGIEVMVDRPKRAAPEEWDFSHEHLAPRAPKKRLAFFESSYCEGDAIIGRQVMDVLGADSQIDDSVLQLLSVESQPPVPALDDPLLILSEAFDETHEIQNDALAFRHQQQQPQQQDQRCQEDCGSHHQSATVPTMLPDIIQGGYEVFLQDDSLFVGAMTTGPWRLEEEKLLLHIMYSFIDAELRTMAVVAWKCGIHRPKRAIDKKIKRTLRFSKWRERDNASAQQEILRLLREKTFAALPQHQFDCLAAVRVELQRLGLPSFDLLPRDACLDASSM